MSITRARKTSITTSLAALALATGMIPAAAQAGAPPVAASVQPAAGVMASVTPGGGTGCQPDGVVGPVSCDLYATTGSVSLPGGATATVWGYTDVAGAAATVPGPAIVVDEGDTVTVTLHNELNEPTALWFPQLPLAPDPLGAAPSATTSYTFVASHLGTFVYEAGGATGPHQVAMGMSGVIVVRPFGGITETDDHLVVVSEFDLDLLNSANPAAFDLRNYRPEFWVVNGQASPTTGLAVAAGGTYRLRYVNTGLRHHSIGLLGLSQHIDWMNGFGVPAGGSPVVAESLAPGETAEAVVTIPAGAPDGARYALYEASFLGGANGFGGMLAFLEVGGTPPTGGGTPPVTSGVLVTPSVSTDGSATVAATVSDPDGVGVDAAELFLDSTGADGFGVAPDAGTTYTWSFTGLASGVHTVYVHGMDTDGWGSYASASFRVDVDGPVVSGLSARPNPSSGQVAVTVSATANDTATGNSGITAGEYRIDGGTAVPMTVTPAGAPIASLDGIIPATVMQTLATGSHTVEMRAHDAAGHWSGWSGVPLTIGVDAAGPVTSGVMIQPAVTNGTTGYSPSIQALRVDATFTDADSNISAGEGFIDTVLADGTGFPMTPKDGLYNSKTESGYVYVPLTTIRQLLDGPHQIHVHGKDASGNWGPTVAAVFTLDRQPPVMGLVAASPNPTFGAQTVTVNASATDTWTAVTAAEWFVGTDPGLGNGTAMGVTATGLSATVSASMNVSHWAPGDYVISVRVRDAAGNWSTAASTTLTVTHPVWFSTTADTTVGGQAADSADVWFWDELAFARMFDANAGGLGGGNVDGLARVDDTHFYVSFAANTTTVPGIGSVQDEDVAFYNNGTWSVWFDGTALGLTAGAQDLSAIDVVGGVLYFATDGDTTLPGGLVVESNDIVSWSSASGFQMVFDASVAGLPTGSDVDGLAVVDATHLFLSFTGNVGVPGIGTVQDEDVVYFDGTRWSVYFDGTGKGLTAGAQDLDAIDVP